VRVAALLDEAEGTAADMERKLYGSVDGQLAEVQATRDGMEAVLKGSVGSKLDQATLPAQKAFNKLRKSYDQKLSDAYTYAAHAGVVYPTMEDVVYGLQSGDYLGSVGIGGKPPSLTGGSGNDFLLNPNIPPPPTVPPIPPAPPPSCPEGSNLVTLPGGGWWCKPIETPPPGGTPPPPPPAPGFGQPPPGAMPPPPTLPPGGAPGFQQPPLPPGSEAPPCIPWNGLPDWPGWHPWDFAANPPPGNDPCQWANGCNLVPSFGQSRPFNFLGYTLLNPVTGATRDPVPSGWVAWCWKGSPDPTAFGSPGVTFYLPSGWYPVVWGYGAIFGVTSPGLKPASQNCFVPCTRQPPPTGTIPPPPPIPPPTPPPIKPPACDQCCCCPCQCDKPKPPPGPPVEQCALPPKLDCHAEAKAKHVPPLKGDDQCQKFQDAQDGFRDLELKLLDWFTIASQAADPGFWGSTPGKALQAVVGSGEPLIPGIVRRVAAWLQERIKDAANTIDCDVGTIVPVWVLQAVYQVITHYSGIQFGQLSTKLDQLSNFICQSKMPSGAEADRAWLANTIDFQTWQCWHKAAGDLLVEAQAAMRAGRTFASVQQSIRSYWRKLIDEKRFNDLMRQNGVTDQDERAELVNVERAWPAMTDVIRFMVRDVEDAQVVADAGLDTDFDLKWTGKAKEYGEGLGVDDELAKRYWRAHWKIPSFTMLSHMLHRLRPGDVEAGLEVTPEMVERALKQDDWAPAWVKRMMAVSYKPVTRIDARRMYQLHTIDEDQLAKYLQNDGYAQADAEALARYFKAQRDVTEAKASGLPSIRTAVNQYARGELTGTDLRMVADRLTVTEELADEVMEAATLARDTYQRTQEIKGIRKRYVACLLTQDDAHTLLAGAGVDADEVVALVEVWDYDRKCKGREFTASQLCQLRRDGLITAAQQVAALQEAGYSGYQARLMSAQCQRQIDEELAKQAAKEEAAAQRAAEKAAAARIRCKPAPCPPGRESIAEQQASAGAGANGSTSRPRG
jgi:hypothetical protein